MACCKLFSNSSLKGLSVLRSNYCRLRLNCGTDLRSVISQDSSHRVKSVPPNLIMEVAAKASQELFSAKAGPNLTERVNFAHAGRPFRAIVSITPQKRSSSGRVV